MKRIDLNNFNKMQTKKILVVLTHGDLARGNSDFHAFFTFLTSNKIDWLVIGPYGERVRG
jgi:hypothetical protein